MPQKEEQQKNAAVLKHGPSEGEQKQGEGEGVWLGQEE